MNKRKLIAGVIIFIICSFGNIYLSSVAHGFFSHNADWSHIGTFADNLHVILSDKGAKTIFLSVEVFIIIGIVLASVTRVQSYKSDLVNVTDDIVIPKSVGQNQYGSARFYRKDELDKVFTVVTIKKSDDLIRQLMEHGYDDLQEG